MWSSQGNLASVWAFISLATTINAFDSALHACPAPCEGSTANWTLYTSVNRLSVCQEPILLDLSLNSAISSAGGETKLFACTASNASSTSVAPMPFLGARAPAFGSHGISHQRLHRKDRTSKCNPGTEHSISLSLKKDSTSDSAATGNVHSILQVVHDYLSNLSSCNATGIFGFYNGVAVGFYAGAAIDNVRSVPSVVQNLRSQISTAQTSQSMLMERCEDTPNADYIIGLAVDTSGNLAAVQKAMRSWNNGQCAESSGTSSKIDAMSIHEMALGIEAMSTGNSTIVARSVSKRGDCTTKSVIGGDTCTSMAQKCGVSLANFEKFNPAPNFCNLAVGERVCCSAGTLPDIKPKPNADGSCHTYQVQYNDHCGTIAAANGLIASDISDFNDETTWGWFGCNDLQIGSQICLSKGNPPMPAPVSNAVCGPTVAGTKAPTNGTTLAALNPCPLNACCDIWGQCGITAEYCTNTTGPTGNPGTAPTKQNGCISNCGTKIKNSIYDVGEFMNVGYYETWNYDRPCLNMAISDVDVSEYTHVHWAFAGITENFNVTINNTYNQWNDFKNMIEAKRILSFGGWGFSTSASTYDQLRQAMEPANVDTFVDNIFKFVEANGLDGVDFDWEYPGAPDIPGIPAGLASDGPNYLNFLKKMKDNFPIEKTVSIAAPASFWYLRSFPINEMAKYLDYIVYMTYDLHGQWDYDNSWSQEGCMTGNCLRSQINLTETEYALAMITKAGVDSNKIMVGVPSYGRSFGMADPSCTGPDCHFTGTNTSSTAAEGRCTRTAGMISNAEINEILEGTDQNMTYYDQGSDSNIIVWNSTWAAFMDGDTMKSRTNYYQGLKFGGTVDWAVDLIAFTGDTGAYNRSDNSWDEPAVPSLAKCSATFESIDVLGAASGSIPEHCSTQYILQTLSNSLSDAMKNYTDLMNGGYDAKFKIYADTVVSNAPLSVHDFMYQNGSNYFTCKVTEPTVCCDTCNAKEEYQNCADYCWTDDKCTTTCQTALCHTNHQTGFVIPNVKYKDEDEPCPPDFSKRLLTSDQQHESVTWSLVDDKATEFWADLYAATAMNKTYITFGTYNRVGTCASSTPSDNECWNSGYDFSIPQPTSDFGDSDIANPKDTAQKGLSRSTTLPDQISSTLLQIKTDTFIGDGTDIIDAISVPVLMIVSAVQEMSKVEDIAANITAQEKKMKEEEIIGGFIAALLFLVPVAGEVLGAVDGMAEVAAGLTLAGAAADVGLSVADIVKNPDNAALDIMNIIFDVGALADVTIVAKAAGLRRTMKEADVTKLGTRVSGGLESVEKIIGKCYS